MSTPVRAATTAAVPAQTIGFRPEGPSAPGSMTVLGVLVAVLALGVVALLYAQRRGWLKAWTVPRPASVPSRLAVEERLRVSPRTVIYRVRDGDQTFHVIESTAQITVQRP